MLIEHNVLQSAVFFECERGERLYAARLERLVGQFFCRKDDRGGITQVTYLVDELAALARAEKIAAAAHFQIVFRDLESVRVVF